MCAHYIVEIPASGKCNDMNYNDDDDSGLQQKLYIQGGKSSQTIFCAVPKVFLLDHAIFL